MAKSKAVGFTPQTARRILKAVGGTTTVQVQEFTRPSSGGSTSAQFFQLTADVAGTVVTGKPVTFDPVTDTYSSPAPDAEEVDLINWRGLLDGAVEGDVFEFITVDGEWVFMQGKCIGSGGGEEPANSIAGGSASSTPTAVYNGGNADSLPVQGFGVDGGSAA